MREITGNQLRVYDYIKKYETIHHCAPTIPELCEHIGCSHGEMREYLTALEIKGWITRKKGRGRGIKIVQHNLPEMVTYRCRRCGKQRVSRNTPEFCGCGMYCLWDGISRLI
jgi:SOS-response transcriptional repressor LexA